MSFRYFFLRAIFFTSILVVNNSMVGMEGQPNDINSQESKSRSRSYVPQQSVPTVFDQGNNNNVGSEFGSLNQGRNNVLFKESIRNAPDEIKTILRALSHPNPGKAARTHQLIGLVGPSGSGKSTLAKAIARELGKDYLFVPAPVLAKHYKNNTSETIRSLFEHLRTYQNLPALILDEVNKLVDDHGQLGSDSDMSATAIWEGFDACLDENPDLIIIATSNDFKSMPKPLKRRFSGKTYGIPHKPLNHDTLLFAVKAYTDYTLSAQCASDPFLDGLTDRCQHFSTAEINTMIEKAGVAVLLRNGGENGKRITKEDINMAYAKMIESREVHLDLNGLQESGEDKRLRITMEQTQRIADRANRIAIIQAEFQANIGSLNAWQKKRDEAIGALNSMEPGMGLLFGDIFASIRGIKSYSEYYDEYHQDMLAQMAALDRPALHANPQPQPAQSNQNSSNTNTTEAKNDSCCIL